MKVRETSFSLPKGSGKGEGGGGGGGGDNTPSHFLLLKPKKIVLLV